MEYILYIFKFTPWAWLKELITMAIVAKIVNTRISTDLKLQTSQWPLHYISTLKTSTWKLLIQVKHKYLCLKMSITKTHAGRNWRARTCDTGCKVQDDPLSVFHRCATEKWGLVSNPPTPPKSRKIRPTNLLFSRFQFSSSPVGYIFYLFFVSTLTRQYSFLSMNIHNIWVQARRLLLILHIRD